MQIIDYPQHTQIKAMVATIGFFDGVHSGHKSLIAEVRRIAAESQLASGIVTFKCHPKTVLSGKPMPLITSTEERLERLAATKVDYCVLLDFNLDMAQMSAHDFMAFLRDNYHIQHLVVGYDHRFGHNVNESYDDYCRFGEELGIKISRATVCKPDGHKVSSSIIRKLLSEGNVKEASFLLSYDYQLEGRVIAGHQIGRRIGYPTANIVSLCPQKIIPANGVYAVRVYLEDNIERCGMLNIGTRPTVDETDHERSIEVHIFDFNKSIYGQTIRIEFVAYLRPERRMDDIEALRYQLSIDKEIARGLLI